MHTWLLQAEQEPLPWKICRSICEALDLWCALKLDRHTGQVADPEIFSEEYRQSLQNLKFEKWNKPFSDLESTMTVLNIFFPFWACRDLSFCVTTTYKRSFLRFINRTFTSGSFQTELFGMMTKTNFNKRENQEISSVVQVREINRVLGGNTNCKTFNFQRKLT